MGAPSRRGEESEAKRWLETAAATFGAAVTLAILAIIVWDGVSGGGSPPFVQVEALGVHEQEGGFVLEILASNRGGGTASQVVVQGELRGPDAVVETSETTFDYVPRQSQREGGLFFEGDPRRYQIDLRALGYVDP